ncbi:MAG: FAD-binding oxidoreductase [Alphaproteobacteria bacterium]|nr:FAD-binding oxidoreductase [Alphaproteobacteria bacterium]
MERYDVMIVGAGIAGASAGYFLAASHNVVLLEREDHPGYHSTGRSAALFTETYGNAAIRALTRGARPFFESAPAGFAETPLLTPRGLLYIGREDQRAALQRTFRELSSLTHEIRRISPGEALDVCPILRGDYVAGAMLEPDCMDIDVAALHQGYLKGVRARGGRVLTDAGVRSLRAEARHGWIAQTALGDFAAPVVVNAAGAWVDEIAALAGVPPAGLVPKRRTAMFLEVPDGVNPSAWPMVVDVDEAFYFKPDAGRLLLSPADETPGPPCDAQPEDLDIALAVDRVEKATTLRVRRIAHKWAGLRTFAADRTMIAGFEPGAAGFFWLAGQGGYGIQTSPSMGRLAAALIAGAGAPADLADLGIATETLAVQRLR